MKQGHTINMLQGPLLGPTLRFALPLIATGVVQQSFNATDALVIGHFCPSSALAAVGSNGPVVNLIVTLFMGLGVGVNVVIASFVGRADRDGARRAVGTSALLALVSGIALMLLGSFVSRPLLEVLATPEDVLEGASLYLKIIFLGMPFVVIYNFGAAILRSVGDTARPFYILLCGGVVNAVLDYYFTGCRGMGVAGVAIATDIGIGVNALLITILLLKDKGYVRLEPKALRFHRRELRNIVNIGLPAGLQGLVFSLSNVFILSSINSFGSAASAGSAAALNYELYGYYIIVAFVQSTVAFTSQNYAAGMVDRCRRVYIQNMILAVVGSLIMNVIVVLNKGFFIGIFTSDPSVLPYAYDRLTMVFFFQFLACSYEVSGGAMRALGYSMTPTILTIFGTCVLRLVWVWILPTIHGTFGMLMAVYPVSWAVTGVVVVIAYVIVSRRAYKKLTYAPEHV